MSAKLGHSGWRREPNARHGLGAQKAAVAAVLRISLQADIDAAMTRPLISEDLLTAVERAAIAHRVKAQYRSTTGIGSVRGKSRGINSGARLPIWEMMT